MEKKTFGNDRLLHRAVRGVHFKEGQSEFAKARTHGSLSRFSQDRFQNCLVGLMIEYLAISLLE